MDPAMIRSKNINTVKKKIWGLGWGGNVYRITMRKTLEAAVKFKPTPPALSDINKI